MHSSAFYQEWRIAAKDPQQREILIAQLSELGFEGFEEAPGQLHAYGPKEGIRAGAARRLLAAAGLEPVISDLAPQNWNALWEESFEPVTVDRFCRIRAHFHPSEEGYLHELCITPKMSFGTGHHATTRMMIQMMAGLDFTGQSVLDFGAGTGVLAILAERLGAARILALENEPGAVENARENVGANAAARTEVREGSLEQAGDELFDILLANINRSILVQYAPAMAIRLRLGGQLLVSGILQEDESLLKDTFQQQGFQFSDERREGNWSCLRFTKDNISLRSLSANS